ncbi:hypothetical protein H5410_053877, partial [Solanum commersonii]
NLTWFPSVVYAECGRNEKRELATVRSMYDGSWVVCGGFNVTTYPIERIDYRGYDRLLREKLKEWNEENRGSRKQEEIPNTLSALESTKDQWRLTGEEMLQKVHQDALVISGEEQIWMQREFEEEEVPNAIKICAGDKSPGPDGSPMVDI